MPLFQSPKISSNTRPALWIGLLLSSLLVTALPLNAAAQSDYDTAVSCAGGLGFMATMLPAGSDPAKEAAEREAAWTAEAQRVSRKNQSSTQADIRSATDETKAVMMSGDQAKIAAFMGPLNDACAELPKPEPEPAPVPNPFQLDNPTANAVHERAIVCAGTYLLGTNDGDKVAAEKYVKFFDLAIETAPEKTEQLIAEEILKSGQEWIGIVLKNETTKGMNIISLCNRGLKNLG